MARVNESDNDGKEGDGLPEGNRPLYTRPPHSTDPYPWLVINHGRYLEWNTFFSLTNNRYYTRSVIELSARRLVLNSSCYGWWFVINKSRREYFLVEPISMQLILLPPLLCKCVNSCLLTAAPSDPNCHYLVIDAIEQAVTYGRVGDDDFTKHKFQGQHLWAAVECDGTIYGLMNPINSVVRITLEGKTLRLDPIISQPPPEVLPNKINRLDVCLIESCCELLYVLKIYSPAFRREVVDIKILKFVVSESKWEELKNLGDRVIFLGKNTGICCVAPHQNGGNRVYFYQDDSFKIYEFHLQDSSISISLPYAHKVVTYPEVAGLQWVLMPGHGS